MGQTTCHRILHTPIHNGFIAMSVFITNKLEFWLRSDRNIFSMKSNWYLCLWRQRKNCFLMLLDIDWNTLRKRPVEEQENYVCVAKAAIRAGQRTHAGRASRLRSKNRRVSIRQSPEPEAWPRWGGNPTPTTTNYDLQLASRNMRRALTVGSLNLL